MTRPRRLILADKPVDWFRVLLDLKREGMSLTAIAWQVDVSKSTVIGWKNLEAEPRYIDGHHLLRLWHTMTRRPMDEAPRRVL